MAFTYTTNVPDVFGNKKNISGTYTSAGGSTGGDIVTGFSVVQSFSNTSATASPSTVATISAGTITITTTANQTGVWAATGY